MPSNVLPIAPNFEWFNVVSDQVREIVTTYTTEQLDALNKAPKKSIAWANIGTAVTVGTGIVKVPVRLPSQMFFEDFDAKRSGGSMDVFAMLVKASPKMLNKYWPMIWGDAGFRGIGSYAPDGTVQEFMGAGNIAGGIVEAARAHKAYLAATLTYKGFTSAALGVTATALTYAQPGAANGLPLWTNGTDSPAHFAHPFDPTSERFVNLYEDVGPFADYLPQVMIDMYSVPHPSMPNMTLENQVTDIVGPTWMQDTFWRTAIQNLQMQAQILGANSVAAASSNAYAAEMLSKMSSAAFIGASGIGPVRYWTTSLLNKHPYYWNHVTNTATANMTNGRSGGPSDMWLAISAADGDVQRWAQFAGPSKEFVPRIFLFGDGDPTSIAERRIRMLSDLDAGVGAGLPHPTKMYFEK